MTGTRITSLWASVIYPFIGDTGYPLLQWREEDDTEVMAIYLVPDTFQKNDTDGSWIMHLGKGISNDLQPLKSFIAWNVVEISHLKTLFQAAQHISGILDWSKDDAYRLYCDEGSEECSNEE